MSFVFNHLFVKKSLLFSKSCEDNVNTMDNYNLGDPGTTTFQSRTGPSDPNPTNAIVVDSSDAPDGGKRRTIGFLICDPNSATVTANSQGNEGGSTDPDQYALYVTN